MQTRETPRAWGPRKETDLEIAPETNDAMIQNNLLLLQSVQSRTTSTMVYGMVTNKKQYIYRI